MKAPKRRTERQDTHTHTWELMSCHFIKPTATPRVLTPLQSSLSAVIAPSWPALSRHPPNAAFTSLGHFLNIQLSSHMICAQLSKSSNWELFFFIVLNVSGPVDLYVWDQRVWGNDTHHLRDNILSILMCCWMWVQVTQKLEFMRIQTLNRVTRLTRSIIFSRKANKLSKKVDLPAHLVLVISGGPGGPVPPSPGLDRRTLISYSTSGSRCHSL